MTNGIATRFKILAELHDRERIDLAFGYLGAAGPMERYLSSLNIPVHSLECDSNDIGGLSKNAITKLGKLLTEIQPDVIHSSTGTANYVAVFASRLNHLKNKTQTRVRTLSEEVCIPERKLISRLKFFSGHLLTDRVIGVSSATRDYLIRQEGAFPSKVDVVLNAYPPIFENAMARTRPYPEDGVPFRLLMVSRVSTEKNHPFALRAFAAAQRRSSVPLELHIVGDEPESRRKLEALASNLNILQHVHFLGIRSNVQEIMSNADLYLLPSLTEAFGITLAEAMRCHAPVLASNVGGIPEVLEGYPEGHLLPLNEDVWSEAIIRLAQTPLQDRLEIGRAGFELAGARFSPYRYVRELEDMYLQVTGS